MGFRVGTWLSSLMFDGPRCSGTWKYYEEELPNVLVDTLYLRPTLHISPLAG
jgi:hypothetical protein